MFKTTLWLIHAYHKSIKKFIGDAEDHYIFIPIYELAQNFIPSRNFLHHHYIVTYYIIRNYQRDEKVDADDNASDGKRIKYKTKIIGKAPAQPPQSGNLGDDDRSPQSSVPSSLDLVLLNC